MDKYLTKTNRAEVCAARALAIPADSPVIYVKVPSGLHVESYSFDRCGEFWSWLARHDHDYDFRSFSRTEWLRFSDELEEIGWGDESIERSIASGIALFNAGAKTIAQIRLGDIDAIEPDCDGREHLWGHAHRDLHCGYLITREEARKIVLGAIDAPALSPHRAFEVRRLLENELAE